MATVLGITGGIGSGKSTATKILSEILNVPYDEMYKHVSKKTSIERVHPEGRKLDYETADKTDHKQFKKLLSFFIKPDATQTAGTKAKIYPKW